MNQPDQPTTNPWTIVTQVKSHRVVYFTDDPSYRPPMDTDLYYCGAYSGELPEAMTLRTCWGWRFDGREFQDCRGASTARVMDSVLLGNRKALLAMLNEKINQVREPHLPSSLHGAQVRQAKLNEAQAWLSGTRQDFPYLKVVAVSRSISLHEAAQLIVSKAEATERVLLSSERFRETFTQAIDEAKNQAQLQQVREWLIDHVSPELSRAFLWRDYDTEPPRPDRLLGDDERQHEIERLKLQLREAINGQRADLGSHYLHNEDIRKHKARLAQAVLANSGVPPAGLDITLLQGYAQARQLSLAQAAELIVNAVAESAQVLTRTETFKDQMLARIDAVRTPADVQSVGDALGALPAQEPMQ